MEAHYLTALVFYFGLSQKKIAENCHLLLTLLRFLRRIIYICVMWECDAAHHVTSAGSRQPESCYSANNWGVPPTFQHFVQSCISVPMVIQYFFVHGAHVGVNPSTTEDFDQMLCCFWVFFFQNWFIPSEELSCVKFLQDFDFMFHPFFSSQSAAAILHSANRQWDHARRQRQYHVCGGGLAHAIRQMDAGRWGPHARRRHAHRTERLGAHRCAPVCQLHLCGHVNFGGDRSYGADNGER